MKPSRSMTAVAVVLFFGIAGCSKKEEERQEASKEISPARTASPAQGNGTIAGKLVLKGNNSPAKLSIGKDKEVCGDSKLDPALIVAADGGIKNAVIQIADLRQGKTPAKEAELDQVKCEYDPHVLVVPAGATVKIKNSDGILHNVHTESKANTPFNRAQPKFVKEISETFAKAETIAVRCDVHGWMSGWIIVTDNVFYDVSQADGTFKLTDVPAGEYSLDIWHETLGKITQAVEVKAGETVNVSYEMAMKK